MTAQSWPDPHAAVVERALKMQEGTILAREVLALRDRIAALTAEHSGACDDMAVCSNCWAAERIAAAARAEAQVAAVEGLAEDLPDLLQVYAWSHPEGTWGGYAGFVAGRIRAALDAPSDVT